MRIVAVAGGVCLLAVLGYLLVNVGGGEGGKPFEFRHLTQEIAGRRSFELEESAFNTRWQYPLEVKSRVKKPARLEARFEGEGDVKALMAGTTLIPRQATERTTLILAPANKVQTFEGRVVIFSPDLPEWEGEEFHFKGAVHDRGLSGKYLRPRPGAGINLGDVRPDEDKTFEVSLENFGSEPVTITSVTTRDPARIRLAHDAVAGPIRVAPRESFLLRAKCVAPGRAGKFRATIEVFSDASNYPRALPITVAGNVVPDYAPEPVALESNAEYPLMQRVYPVTIRARKGMPPFRVADVERHERYFDVESKGTDEPAMVQTVRLKIRKDAPTNPAEVTQFTILFRLDPGAIEIVVPVRMRFYARIHPSPLALNFGTDLKPREIRVASFGAHAFKVTRVSAERGRFEVHQAKGVTPTIVVSIPKGAPPGVLQDRIVIETDDADQPRLIVPAKAVVR